MEKFGQVEDRRHFAAQGEQRRQEIGRLAWWEEIGDSLTEIASVAQDFITAYNLKNTWM